MEDFFKTVGHIADVIGVVSLPWAIVELFILKSRIKSTQKSMDELLLIKEYQTLSKLSSIISRIQEEISTILLQHGKKGVKQSTLFDQCQLVTNELNKCITDTPQKHEELTNQFIGCKEEIQEYISSSDRNHLKDAQTYIYSCIKIIKEIDSQSIKDESERIANNN